MPKLDIANMNTTVGELQRDYLFTLSFTTIPEDLEETFGSFKDSFDYYCVSAPVPEYTSGMTKLPWAGQFIWVEGVNTEPGSGTFDVYCDAKSQAYEFILALKSLTGDRTAQSMGVIRSARTAELLLVSYDVDKTTPLYTWTYKNFEVSSVRMGSGFKKDGTSFLKFQFVGNWSNTVPAKADVNNT